MGDKTTSHGVAPPPYTRDVLPRGHVASVDAVPPYDTNAKRPSSSPSLPPAYESDRSIIRTEQGA